MEPRENGIHASGEGDAAVELLVHARAYSFDLRFGADPEERRRFHALLFGGDPDRLAAPPSRFGDAGPADAEAGLERSVVHRVGHDPVMLGIESGDDRVVIGEGERRKRRDHRVGDDAVSAEYGEGGWRVAVEEIAAESVERDEQHGLRLA